MRKIGVFLVLSFVFSSALAVDFDRLTTQQVKGLVPSSVSGQAALISRSGVPMAVFTGVRGRKPGIFSREWDDRSSAWGELVQVSPAEQVNAHSPSAFLAADETLHAIWLSSVRRGPTTVFHASHKLGGGWSAAHDVFSGTRMEAPGLVFGPDGKVFVFASGRPGDSKRQKILFGRSADGGESWAGSDPNFAESKARGGATEPRLVTAGDRLHLVWLDQSPGAHTVVYNQSEDGGRSWREIPVSLVGNSGFNSSNPVVVTDGTVLAAFWKVLLKKDPNWETEIHMSISRDQGKTWESERKVATSATKFVQMQPFVSPRAIGLVWTAKFQLKETSVLNRFLVFGEGEYLEQEKPVSVSSTDGALFEDLSVVSDGELIAVVTLRREMRPGQLEVFAWDEEQGRWDRKLTKDAPPGRSLAGPVVSGDVSGVLYTMLFHEVRRRRSAFEPDVWDSILWAHRFRFAPEQ